MSIDHSMSDSQYTVVVKIHRLRHPNLPARRCTMNRAYVMLPAQDCGALITTADVISRILLDEQHSTEI
jgi:hypothetical protein